MCPSSPRRGNCPARLDAEHTFNLRTPKVNRVEPPNRQRRPVELHEDATLAQTKLSKIRSTQRACRRHCIAAHGAVRFERPKPPQRGDLRHSCLFPPKAAALSGKERVYRSAESLSKGLSERFYGAFCRSSGTPIRQRIPPWLAAERYSRRRTSRRRLQIIALWKRPGKARPSELQWSAKTAVHRWFARHSSLAPVAENGGFLRAILYIRRPDCRGSSPRRNIFSNRAAC
jgi:hypothetical protein